MPGHVSRDLNWLHFLLPMWALMQVTLCQPYQLPHRCSNRLENALEHMRRRSVQTKSSSTDRNRGSRAMWEPPPQSPYQLYHSFYGQHSEPEDDFYNVGGGAYNSGRGYHAKLLHRSGRPYPFSDSSSALELEDLLAVNQETHQEQQQQQQHRQPHKLAISRVDVEDLKVRVPPAKSANRWVEIDKCKFSTENSTLDTRLIFPDLTLSGKVVMQPMGGKCHMILRLRHAGIEFRTVPLGYDPASGYEQSRRLGAASVRTDSHFAEPGFISVFAHGCQGPSGIRLRQNSKRRFGNAPEVELGEPHVILGTNNRPQGQRWGKYHHQQQQQQQHPQQPQQPSSYDIRLGQNPQRDQSLELGSDSGEFVDVNGDNFYRRQFGKRRRRRRRYAQDNFEDQMNFSEDVLHFEDEQLQQLVEPDARAFADIFSAGSGNGAGASSSGYREELVGEAMSHELEKLFSMGVRGLLTTYMQRALQPAIKETLMENMGYTLSYG